MSAQGDCEFLVQRARELVQQDLWAAKAWLITARSLYPADFNIQVRPRRCSPPAAGLLPAGRAGAGGAAGAAAGGRRPLVQRPLLSGRSPPDPGSEGCERAEGRAAQPWRCVRR